MKWQFSHSTNLFFPIFIFSFLSHIFILRGGDSNATSIQYSVVDDLNSVQILLIEEPFIKEKIEEEIEEILVAQRIDAMLPKVDERKVFEESVVKKIVEQRIESVDSLGAIVEAVPLGYANPAPLYPPKAKRRGWEGIVLLKVHVEVDGLPSKVEIQKSSGYRILDDSAVDTVHTWRFEPAQADNGKISSWVVIPVHFKLVSR